MSIINARGLSQLKSLAQKPGELPDGVETKGSFSDYYRHIMNSLELEVQALEYLQDESAEALREAMLDAASQNPSAEKARKEITAERRRMRL